MFIGIVSQNPALFDCASAFTPRIEQSSPDTIVLDVSGLDRLHGSPKKIADVIARRASELGIAANIAVAANPDAAIHGARGLPGITVIPRGKEAAVLGRLPVELLQASPDILQTFDCWGIHTFRDLAALPEMGVAERLGPEGIRLQKLARGVGDRPLRPLIADIDFEESIELEHPITLLEPLSFVLARLLNQLCANLESHALALIEMRLCLGLENHTEHVRTLRLPTPMREPRTFLKWVQLDLNAHPPAAPIIKISIAAEPAKPRVTQNGLFVPLSPEPLKLELTMARIAGIVGENNIGSPELLDTHRPDAFRIKRFSGGAAKAASPRERQGSLSYRLFRPLRHAHVHAPGGHPTHISARGVQGKVLSFAGPWRSSGDWWTPDAWARDEWDIALTDGALYRVYRDRQTTRWFVDGTYD
jgi:protein ImuB